MYLLGGLLIPFGELSLRGERSRSATPDQTLIYTFHDIYISTISVTSPRPCRRLTPHKALYSAQTSLNDPTTSIACLALALAHNIPELSSVESQEALHVN